MNWITPFLNLIRSVGWPPPWVFARSFAPVFVWQVASLVPSLSEAEKLAWAVLSYFTVFFWTRAPFSARIINRDVLGTAIIFAIGLWSIVAGLVLLAPDPVWLQRWFTTVYTVLAFCCLVDMWLNEQTALTGLRAEVIDLAGPQLMRAFFLVYLMLAILNETLIAHLSIKAWVLCLAMLPVFSWIVSRALTRTVCLSVRNQENPR